MQLEQPGTQDSGNIAPQPDDLNNDPLELNPAEPNDPADPDLVDPPEDDEEIEIGDKKFALPKSAAERLKSERMMQADYTRKTQEVAETRKAIEAQAEQIRQHAEQSQQYIKELSKVHALDEQLAEFQKVTPAEWQALIDTDPLQAQKLQVQYQSLQQQRNQAAQAVTQKQHDQALAQQQETAKLLQDAEAYVASEIKGWTPERTAQINAFAAAQGVKMDPETVRVMLKNPALFKIMHNAELFDQLAKKHNAKPQPAAAPAPVTRVGAARASAAKDPSKMSDAEWLKTRREQQRKR